MSNLSILQRNIIHALDCDFASDAFLWACDRTNVLAAERYANELKYLREVLSWMIDARCSLRGPDVPHELGKPPDGLLDFFLERHKHYRFPQRGKVR